MTIEVLGPANIELTEATVYYSARDSRVAGRFAAEVRRVLELLEAFPQIGSLVPGVEDETVRQMPVHGFPYAVVFVRMKDRLQVVAIAHSRRKPGYFINRLRRA